MRIISLLASATEIIAELGCLEQMVGRSHECDYPPEILHLPIVSTTQIDINASSEQIDAQIKQLVEQKDVVRGDAFKALSIYALDVNLLQQLQPDVIFTQTQCEVCAVSERDVMQAIQHLTELQPRVVSLTPYQLSDVWEDVLRVGKALDHLIQAQELVRSYQQRLEQLQAITTGFRKGKAAPRVALLEWLDPLMATGNWTPELITYAGGENIFGEIGQHAPWVTWEELQATDPEILVLAPCGFTLERTLQELHVLKQHPAWNTLQAVQQGRVYAIDGNSYINRSGPRLVESAAILARVIWGMETGIDVPEKSWQPVIS
ncbi:MAG: cobalamin-binding protein [Ktedonobacteraceae bacterium]|nr:cobalamin-binding protein [Ktedonobacteraceae bacterium]